MRHLRRTVENFFPTIAEIRRTAAEITLALPTDDEALSQIESRISWGNRDETTRGAAPDVHPDVRRALDHVGGFFAFRSTADPAVVRGQFLRIYRDIRGGRVRSLQVGDFRPQITAAA